MISHSGGDLITPTGRRIDNDDARRWLRDWQLDALLYDALGLVTLAKWQARRALALAKAVRAQDEWNRCTDAGLGLARQRTPEIV